MSDQNEHRAPGAVEPATLKKAGCGIRYDEDELRDGIDFSGAAQLRPISDEETDHASADPQPTATQPNRSDETP